MAVRSAAIRWLLAIPLALIALYTVLCMAIYIVGARHLPDRLAPTASQASPGIRAQLLRVEADMAPGDTCVDTAWWRSTDDIADMLLAESVYVRCSIGIEQAAPAYFGRPATQLRPQESLALIALLKGPGWHDPDRNPERFRKRYAQLAEQPGHRGPAWSADAALARLTPAACLGMRPGRTGRAGQRA
jgi:hypothetical protein